MDDKKRHNAKVDVKIIKAYEDSKDNTYKTLEKSDKAEQLSEEAKHALGEWIPHTLNMRNLKNYVDSSTILPQCIKAYKNNIAGFGLEISYIEDYKQETDEIGCMRSVSFK